MAGILIAPEDIKGAYIANMQSLDIVHLLGVKFK